jgi:hypothetical protein
MKIIKASVVAVMLVGVSACVAVPYEPGYGGGYYGPGYYGPPAVVSPSVGFTYYGGSGGYYRHGPRYGGHGHWR